MHDPIPDPVSGKSVLDWAVPVTRRLNALGDKVGATARNERDRRASAKPLPFEVRWDATLNDGAGAWKIYLPTEHLLSYGGTYITTSDISGATPIPDANGDDSAWSILDDIDTSADHVWLVVTIPDESAADAEDGEEGEDGEEVSSGGSIEAEFASEEGQSVTGSTVINICIAEVSYEEPEDEGGTPTVEIKQSVVGALHLGGKSDSISPDDVSTEFIPEPEEGEEPTGDEGKLQIKGFKDGAPADQNTLADYLQGNADIPSDGMQLVARWTDSDGAHLVYIPLAAFPDDNGKTIADVEVAPSSSETVVKFTYTDGSFTEIHIPHGLPGAPGAPGADGTTPEITSINHEGVTTIYADGEVIATVRDGHTPVITGQKVGGVTTLYADGVPIAQIADGSGGGSAELPDKNVVTGVSFAISGGKLVATLTKENLKTGATSTSTANVCDVGELDVVVSEGYSTSTHQFTNTRKRIKTIGAPVNANGQTPFTATPLSNE